MTPLSIDRLSAQVSSDFTLSTLSCDFVPGQLTGVIGPNGSGKSTLARCLVGLQAIDSGSIQLAGTSLVDLPRSIRAQKIGYLPQHASIAWQLSVRDAIALGRSYGKPRGDDESNLDSVMRQCGISHLAGRNVGELSGGEQMRVHLARVFYGEHQVIVADEPCASLDIEHQHRIMKVLKRHSKENITIVIIHDLSLAQKYCDRLMLFNSGELIVDDEPQAVLRSTECAKIFQMQFSEYLSQHNGEEDGVILLPRSV